jgi:hypothetical protein
MLKLLRVTETLVLIPIPGNRGGPRDMRVRYLSKMTAQGLFKSKYFANARSQPPLRAICMRASGIKVSPPSISIRRDLEYAPRRPQGGETMTIRPGG